MLTGVIPATKRILARSGIDAAGDVTGASTHARRALERYLDHMEALIRATRER